MGLTFETLTHESCISGSRAGGEVAGDGTGTDDTAEEGKREVTFCSRGGKKKKNYASELVHITGVCLLWGQNLLKCLIILTDMFIL